MNFEKAREGIEKSQAGEVVEDDALEGGDNVAKEIGQLTAGDQKVVDLEKNLETVALAGELLLICLRRFVIEGVVYGNSDLRGDALHELELRIGDALRREAAKTHSAEAALRGG